MLEHMSRNCTKDNETKSSFTSKLSFSADICVGLAILSVVFLSVMGNGIVLVICYRRRNKMVGSELLCVNLAVVDFLCCICFYPLSIISSFHHAWLGENVTCIYYGLGCYIFGLCGMFTIAAISIIRYLKICYSLVSELWLEKPNIRLVCCVIWLVSTVWSSFPLFGWVMSHCQTLYKISRFSSSLSARGIHNNLRRAEKRLSMMFFCISLGFVIAWMPYTIVSFLFIFHKEDHYMSPEGFVFPALFAKSSHVYNPFIYFYFNKTFQKELRSLLDIICPKMGRNRVSAHNALNIQAPDPIHIQLQERPHVHKIFALSRSCTQSKSKTSGKDTNGNHGLKRRVNTCWGSTPGRAPVILEEAKVNNPLPLSVTSV
ncbi:opsin 8, group member c isoform X2 [Corythoichthys intestinalis]|uniref:opsin 8, group member c isoform X2 n=1 Tax=Corythoichthys intestinalis TaxID=161448 RepID=UPI0025A66904|nr:opsin 8, group member c isoform X2 [Corythoichthys intestinalis]